MARATRASKGETTPSKKRLAQEQKESKPSQGGETKSEHKPTPHDPGQEAKAHEPTLSEQEKLDKAEAEAKEAESQAPDAPGEPARVTGEIRLEGGSLDFNRLADILASLDDALPVLQGSNKTKIVEHFASELAQEDGFDHGAFVGRASQ